MTTVGESAKKKPALPVLPGATLGVLGGGQLGRMFAAEAIRMGYRVWVFDPDPKSPAGALATQHFQAEYQNESALKEFGEGCDAITIEFENVPADSVRYLSRITRVKPDAISIEIAQDRRAEKNFIVANGLATTPFGIIENETDLPEVCRKIGFPSILKTARLGYDGKGQAHCYNEKDVAAAFDSVGEVACVLEKRVDLEKEISVVLSRSDGGQINCFPIAQNSHVNGILDTTVVPADITASQQAQAVALASTVVSAMDYVGVMAVELFVDQADNILINEMAPRPHNSGHYTLSACPVSQFEQQVRVLCGLASGNTAATSAVAMLNLLGDRWDPEQPNWDAVYHVPGSSLHLYGKAQARKGRKMGHINITASSAQEAFLSVQTLKRQL